MKTTAKRLDSVRQDLSDPADLVHYTPEQVEEKGWTPFNARTLRDKAGAREIPHARSSRGPRGRISFRLPHIREINAMCEARPMSESKPRIAA
ncbi:MAG: hypothetical protein M3R09_10895 [Actinomycetota bacterium]|nr:hypothetical protein [Actinomycetota bacterium]